MLYLTTRIKQDAFTAHRALSENRGPMGGLYLPRQLNMLTGEELGRLGEQSFSQNVADSLNLLFGTRLDSWAVEFAIGRNPVKLVTLGSKAMVAETWHNPTWKFNRLVTGVEKAIRQSDAINRRPSDWLLIAARMAVFTGLIGELIGKGEASPEKPMDIAIPVGDLSAVMAAWYCKEWGLPIDTIIICCNENNSIWNLMRKGMLRTDGVAVPTGTPRCDVMVPRDLERLIFGTLGFEENARFLECCAKGGTYYLEEPEMKRLRAGFFVSVVSEKRMEFAISAIYRSWGYIPDPYTALCYSGMQDHRTTLGIERTTLLLSEESPALFEAQIARCLGLSQRELEKKLNRP